VLRNEDSVFVMCSEASISSANCPPVRLQCGLPVSGRNDRLDCNHQAFRQTRSKPTFIVIRNAWGFMNRSSNTVTAELANHSKSGVPGLSLDDAANFADAVSSARFYHGSIERALGAAYQCICGRGRVACTDRDRGIGIKPVLLSHEIKLNDVA